MFIRNNVYVLSLARFHSLKSLTISYYFGKGCIITNICIENNEGFSLNDFKLNMSGFQKGHVRNELIITLI